MTEAHTHPTLIVPGIDGSGPNHWQTLWESAYPECRRVDLGDWANPEPGSWMRRLTEAVRDHGNAPLTLVGHSLGCLLIAWWAHYQPELARGITTAMLVAPCNPVSARDRRLRTFAPVPANRLPFPTVVVGSRNDPYATFEWTSAFARSLGADLHDAGWQAHINADSDVGGWTEGRAILDRIRCTPPPPARLAATSAGRH